MICMIMIQVYLKYIIVSGKMQNLLVNPLVGYFDSFDGLIDLIADAILALGKTENITANFKKIDGNKKLRDVIKDAHTAIIETLGLYN